MNERIKPAFPKKMPENALSFFNPASDEAFKAAHPQEYMILMTCGFIVIFLPSVIYGILTVGVYPAQYPCWYLPGFMGAFLISIGLFNFVAAWMDQYLGHTVTALGFGLGMLLSLGSAFMMYHDQMNQWINPEMVYYYFINLLLLCVAVVSYIFFRNEMKSWLKQRGISDTEIKQSRSGGRRNHWWYEDLNRRYDLDLPYHVNRVFTLLYLLTFCLHLCFGWYKALSIPVFILYIVICLFSIGLNLFTMVISNRALYDRSFILFARNRNGGIDSTILELLAALSPVLLIWAEILLVACLWDLPWAPAF